MAEKKITLPYFARFLEANVEEKELKDIKAGTTHKYPSDRDDVQYAIYDPLD